MAKMQYSNLSAHILLLHMKALESCYKQKLTHVFIIFNTNGTLPLKNPFQTFLLHV